METLEECADDVVLVSLCCLWTDFTNYSGIAIVDFEQVNAGSTNS